MNININRNKYIKPIFIGIGAALFVFVLGFGIMNIHWYLYSSNDSLPGLYDYYAATIGDGIFLPLLTGFGTAYLNMNNFIQKKHYKKSIIIGIIAALIGLIIQISWLMDDNISLNWTIPEPHTFNKAGWHHCIFFVIMFYIVAVLLTRIYYVRKYYKILDNNASSISYAGFWASGIGFLFMHILDDYAHILGVENTLTISFIFLVLIVLLFTAFSNKDAKKTDIIYLLPGMSTVYALSFIIINDIYNYWIVMVALVVTIVYINPMIISLKRIVVVSIPTSLLIIAFLSTDNIYKSLGLFALIYPIFISKILNKGSGNVNWPFYLWGSLFAIIVMLTGWLPRLSDNVSDILCAVIAFATEYIVFSYIVRLFNWKIVKNENNIKEDAGKEEIAYAMKLKLFVYSIITLIVIASMYLVIIHMTYIVDIELSAELYRNNRLNGFSIIGIVFFTLMFILILNLKKKHDTIILKIISLILSSILYGCTILLLMSYISVDMFRNYTFDWIVILIFTAIIALPLLLSEGFKANIAKIPGKEFTIIHKIQCIIIGIGCKTITIMTCIIVLLPPETAIFNIIVCAICVVFSYVFIPYLSGRCLEYLNIEHENKTITGTGGVLQDGFLWSIMFFCILVVYFTITHTSNLFNMMAAIIALIISIIWPINMCLKNNVQHIKQENKKSLAEEQIKALKYHLRYQNIFCIIATFPFSVMAMASTVLKGAASEEQGEKQKSLKEILKQNYWP